MSDALLLATALLLFTQPAPPSDARVGQEAPRQSARATDSARASIRSAILAGLVREPSRERTIPPERRAATLAVLSGLTTPDDLRLALEVLGGEGVRPNFLLSDLQARRAVFNALSAEPSFGQPHLVDLAVTADDPICLQAADVLPSRLSPQALARLAAFMASDRELFINRAASLASAHDAVELIPSLVTAQYAPPRVQQKGDEAWIAEGKTVHYVQNVIPVVGSGSTSFAPVIGTVYEGSLLRVMESKVEIFRTEVHESLVQVIEDATGEPAPPFGYDSERWFAWFRDDFPRLADAHRARLEEARDAARARTTQGAREG